MFKKLSPFVFIFTIAVFSTCKKEGTARMYKGKYHFTAIGMHYLMNNIPSTTYDTIYYDGKIKRGGNKHEIEIDYLSPEGGEVTALLNDDGSFVTIGEAHYHFYGGFTNNNEVSFTEEHSGLGSQTRYRVTGIRY